MAVSSTHTGWRRDVDNARLDMYYEGTRVGHIDANGLYANGRLKEITTAVDDNSQNMTLAAADIVAGINVHTTVTGAGTVTTDTAANIISGVPLANDNETITSYYINDGTQTATFSGGTGVTISDTGQTVAANEAALLVWRRTSSTAVTCYILGA